MSRSKKSRKPGRINPVKADKKAIVEPKEPRARKSTGNKAGTRQQVANQPRETVEDSQPKDPRIGSKKPIDLGIAIKPVKKKAKPVKDDRPSVAPITVIDDTEQWEKELIAIENNVELQTLADRQDSGEELTCEESELLANSFSRYQELITKLGLESEELAEEENPQEPQNSEDDLWNKLDSTDFSEFEDK